MTTQPLYYHDEKLCIVMDRLDALRNALVIRYLDPHRLEPVGGAKIAALAALSPASPAQEDRDDR